MQNRNASMGSPGKVMPSQPGLMPGDFQQSFLQPGAPEGQLGPFARMGMWARSRPDPLANMSRQQRAILPFLLSGGGMGGQQGQQGGGGMGGLLQLIMMMRGSGTGTV